MGANKNADTIVDDVLTEVGDLGFFQVYTFLLIYLLNFLSAFSVVNYMISANPLEYRCKIPECDIGDHNRQIGYEQPWLQNAIPISNGKIDNCFRFALNNQTNNATGQCSSNMFDTSKTIACSEYVYASDEINIQTEFNIHCSESYKLALIGTAGNLGRFIFLPFTGLLSDSIGRRPGILIGTTLCCLFAIIKSLVNSYHLYIIFEFLEASVGSCTLSGIYVLVMEWMSVKYRVLGNTILSIAFPIGEMLTGVVAMYVHDYRILIRILYTPGLLALLYFWLIPESVRWLLVTGKVDRAIKTLKRIAKVNRKELSAKSIELIKITYTAKHTNSIEKQMDNDNISVFKSICMIAKSKTLGLRFLNCCFQWSACTFSYYGLSMSSTHIPGADRYLSFIIVMAIEIPGVVLAQPLLNRMKRRLLMFLTLFLSSIVIVTSPFIPKEYPMIVLVFFILGKALITCAFTALYVYTVEQWPTSIRNTVMNSCSMIGRSGSMLAPLVVVVGTQYSSLSTLLFGGSALIAAVLALFSSETYLKQLPNTIEDAINL